MEEKDPTGASPKTPGTKLDAGKAPVRQGFLEYFPRAIVAVSMVSAAGAKKYAWNGWQSVPNGPARYGDAGARHVLKAAIEGEIDSDWKALPGFEDVEILHAAEEAWNSMARLELILREKERGGAA